MSKVSNRSSRDPLFYFLHQQEDRREDKEQAPFLCRKRGEAEYPLKGRRINKGSDDDEFRRYAPKNKLVGKQTGPEDRLPLGPAGKDVSYLSGYDAGKGHGRGSDIHRSRIRHLEPGLPPMLEIDKKEAGHAGHCLDRTQKTIGAKKKREVKEPRIPRPRRPIHGPGLRRLGPEAEGGHEIGAEVYGQYLHYGEREGHFEQDKGDKGNDLGYVTREYVGYELFDIGVDGPAFFYGRHDGGEVVVGEDHGGRLLCHVRAPHAHGNTNVRFFKRRRIIDAVAGHGDDFARFLQARNDPHLMLRRHPREDHLFPEEVGETVIVEGVQFAPGHDPR